MTDDLVKRLRGYGSNRYWPHGPACDCTKAAGRIEKLEANLAKAVDALGEAIYLLDPDEEDIAKETGLHHIVTTYAELTGGKDE